MFIFFIFLSFFGASASELRPFNTDGCTLAPEGTWRDKDKWKQCCVAHDLRLWGGGTKSERKDADLKLRSCMEEKAGPIIANIFWLAVKAGSYSPFKLANKEWGNAWYSNSGYRSLSHDEIDQLIYQVQELEIDSDIKETYLYELQTRN